MEDLKPIILPGVSSQKPMIIAGPCSAETEEQVLTTARELAANGIKILEPGDSYTRSDGSSAISYNVKKMFDISQTTSTQKPRTINYDDRVKFTALLKDRKDAIKAPDKIMAVVTSLAPAQYPYSFKKIRTAIIADINSAF